MIDNLCKKYGLNTRLLAELVPCGQCDAFQLVFIKTFSKVNLHLHFLHPVFIKSHNEIPRATCTCCPIRVPSVYIESKVNIIIDGTNKLHGDISSASEKLQKKVQLGTSLSATSSESEKFEDAIVSIVL